MTEWSFYNAATGMFTGQIFTGPASMLPGATPPGTRAMPGHHDHQSRRVDILTGNVVDLHEAPDREQPVALSPTELLWKNVRLVRDKRLRESDWVALRAMDGGPPMTPAWRAYRQALRDITTQPDPLNITWPEKPA